MTEEIDEQNQQAAVSEQPEVESQDQQEAEPKMVPLTALQATRRKLQEAEARAQAYQELVRTREEQQQQKPEEPEDPNALVERKDLQATTAVTKREILETLFQDMNPTAVQQINKYLDPILKKKPWLADSVHTAQNRYARAYEIVQDYMHLVEEKPATRSSAQSDAQRMVQNSQKPRSPAEIGKSAQPSGVEYLKSIQGKKEFREYRQKLLRGEA